MIEITQRTVGLWYVTLPSGDWMGAVDALDGGRFKMTYRFRYYRDTKVFSDSKDVKNWYSGEGDDFGHAVRAMREIVRLLKRTGGGESFENLRGDSSVDEFMARWDAQPFVHKKHVIEGHKLPGAPLEPEDGEAYVDPRNGLALAWDQKLNVWVYQEENHGNQ